VTVRAPKESWPFPSRSAPLLTRLRRSSLLAQLALNFVCGGLRPGSFKLEMEAKPEQTVNNQVPVRASVSQRPVLKFGNRATSTLPAKNKNKIRTPSSSDLFVH
jgi:hypothetical protein